MKTRGWINYTVVCNAALGLPLDRRSELFRSFSHFNSLSAEVARDRWICQDEEGRHEDASTAFGRRDYVFSEVADACLRARESVSGKSLDLCSAVLEHG